MCSGRENNIIAVAAARRLAVRRNAPSRSRPSRRVTEREKIYENALASMIVTYGRGRYRTRGFDPTNRALKTMIAIGVYAVQATGTASESI